MRAVTTAALLLAAATTGVTAAQCPSSLTVNNVTFDPSSLIGTLTGQQWLRDGTAGSSFDFIVNLCAKQSECAGTSSAGNYFITQLYQGTTTCSKGLFSTMTKAPTAIGNSVVASYVDATGLRIAKVEISCGGTSALSSPGNTFTTTLDSTTSTTTFTFTYQSNLLCGNIPAPPRPTPPPSFQCPSSLTVNGVTFDPSGLMGTLTGQQGILDGTAGESFDLVVNMCAMQPECAGDAYRQGAYFITMLNDGTTGCTNNLFDSMTLAPTVRGNSIVASYVDASGVRIANVEISCGGTSALSSPDNFFTMTYNMSATPVTVTFTFTYQSNLLCGNVPLSSPGDHQRKSADVKRLKKK
jgi:hypothetical protein